MAKAHGDDRTKWPGQAQSMVQLWDKAVADRLAENQPVDVTKLTSCQLGQRLQGTSNNIIKSEERLKEREEEFQRALVSRDAEKQVVDNHKQKKQQLEKAKPKAFLREQASGADNPALRLCGEVAEVQQAAGGNGVPECLRGPMQALQQALEQRQQQQKQQKEYAEHGRAQQVDVRDADADG
eukprot:9477303-Pyramimonas_sp.AAC.1